MGELETLNRKEARFLPEQEEIKEKLGKETLEEAENIIGYLEKMEGGQDLIEKVRTVTEGISDEGFQVVIKGLKEVLEKTENPENPYDKLDYHGIAHTINEMVSARKILEEIKKARPELVTRETIEIAVLAAAHHDTVQKYEFVVQMQNANGVWEKVDGQAFSGEKFANEYNPDSFPAGHRVFRARFSGDNEKASGEQLKALMEERGFSESEINSAVGGIDTTVAMFDPKNLTVIQPRLEGKGWGGEALISRALALADLGTAGMVGLKEFITEGNALFREEQPDIAFAIEKKSVEGLTEEQKENYQNRIIGWSGFQVNFAKGRKSLLEGELGDLPDEAKKNLRGLFSYFDESISAAKENLEKRKSMTFEQLIKDIGIKADDYDNTEANGDADDDLIKKAA